MKSKNYLILAATILASIALWSLLRPSPQEQLLAGIKARNLPQAETAMQRGANSTQPIEWGNKQGVSGGYTPLQVHLSQQASQEWLEVLLRNGDVNAHSTTGTSIYGESLKGTPLHYMTIGKTVLGKEAPIVKFLLQRGADVNAKATEPAGWTPLMMAGKPEILQVLLDAGANPNLVAANGACVMNYVGKEPLHNPIWRLLKRYGGRPRRVPDSAKFPRLNYNSVELGQWLPETY